MLRFTLSGFVFTSTPATLALPPEGGNSPHSIRIVVDLPAPLAPSRPKMLPECTLKVILSTAVKCPKRFSSCSTLIAYSAFKSYRLTCRLFLAKHQTKQIHESCRDLSSIKNLDDGL